MKRQRKLGILLFAVLTVLVFFSLKPTTAAASNPSTISFQGKVVNANGTNVADGTYTFLFKLYTASSGGSAIWTESDSLSVAGGVFQVNLGAVCPFFTSNSCNNSTPIDFNANPSIYLGITFNSDPAGEMTPRVQLQSVPYAYNSDKVGGLTVSQLVQLSPGTQQSGFVNVGGSTASTFGAGLNVSGTSTFTQTSGQSLTLTSASGSSYFQAPIGQLVIGNNSYYNGTNNVYGVNGASSIVQQASGSIYLDTAPSGTAGATEAFAAGLTVLNGGNVGIDTLTPGSALAVGSSSQFEVNGSGAIVASTGVANSGSYTQTGTSANTFTGASTFNATGTALTVTNAASVGTLTVTSGGAGITGNSSVTGNLSVSGKTVEQSTTGTAGQGYFIQNSTPNTIAGFQALDLSGSTFSFLDTNKYYNGTNWVDDGLGRTGSSFQIQNDSFTFYSFDTAANFTARFAVASGGNVGVATVSPTSLFSVGTSSQFQVNGSGAIVASTGIANSGAYVQSGSSANTFTGASSFTATGTGLTVTNTGSIGTLSVTAAATIGTGLTVTTGGATITGATTVSGGAINLNVSSNFAVNIATGTSTGAITVGSNLNTFSLASTAVDISTAGAVTGVTTFNASGAVTAGLYNGQTITSAASFTGTVNAATAYQIGGTTGLTLSCTTNDDVINEPVSKGGIMTSGTCRTDTLSDQRLKMDITSLDNSTLDQVASVNPVNFYFNCSESYFADTNTYCDPTYQTGVVAQQLQQIFPDLVSEDQYGYFHVNYQGLSVVTLKAVSVLAQYIHSNGDANLNNVTAVSVNTNSLSSNQIISPSLVSSGALVLNSGSGSNVTIDNSGGSVNIGTGSASNVNIGNGGSTTTINNQLVANGPTDDFGNLSLHFSSSSNNLNIDDAGSTGAITAAINVTDSSGNGYADVFSSPNFTVGGNGNITTGGSIIEKGGSFILDGLGGNQVVSFDSSGDANFSGNLNLANASLSGGLTVGGNVNVAGLSTFQQLATFLAKTVFKQDVEFDGHITVNSDTAGYASLRTGESTVHVTFQNPYTNPPIVTSSIVNGEFGLVSVNNVTDQGFDLSLSVAANAPTTLSWTAVDVNSPQTATNPLPNQGTSGNPEQSGSGGGSSTSTP